MQLNVMSHWSFFSSYSDNKAKGRKQLSKVHHLKILPEYFEAVVKGEKTFEIRKNDRDYCVDDELFLNEFDLVKQEYTGRKTKVIVTYITDYAQQSDYVVMAIQYK